MKIPLVAGGKREKVTKERAEQLVARWTRETEDADGVCKVDISCLSWCKEAFDIIKPFLETISKDVKYAAFADIIAGLMTDEGLAVTEGVAQIFAKSPLIDIDLSDNAMGPRGLSRVESMIANAPLQRLYLGNCGLSYESMILLRDWVTADNNRIANSLEDLLLDRNMMGAEGAREVGEILSQCKNLKYFSYLGCRIQGGTIHLAHGLKNLVQNCQQPALCRLEIDDGNFGESESSAYVPLAEALESCTKMQRLELTDSHMELTGLTRVLEALTTAGVSMTHLGLDGCGELGDEGADILARFLTSQATTLAYFKCSFNELGDSGVPILLEPFSATKCALKELHLECNEIEAESAKALVRTNFPCLEKLNVADNMDLPKRYLKEKYGKVAFFGEDEDDDDEGEDDENMDELVKLLNHAALN